MTTEAPAAVAEEVDTPTTEAEDAQQSNADDTQSSETEAEETTAEADDSQPDNDDDDKPKRKSRSRRYAERITAQAAENAELRRKLEEAQKAVPVVEEPRPKMEDFESLDAYDQAVIEWTTDKVIAKYTKQTEAQRQVEASAEAAKAKARAYQERMEAAHKFIPDFDEVVSNTDAPAPEEHVKDLVRDSERAPELVYHFAANPEVLADINQMSATQAAREIGRLEATLAKPKPRTQSKAPPPVKPLKGAGSTVKPLEELPMNEYAARRTKELYG